MLFRQYSNSSFSESLHLSSSNKVSSDHFVFSQKNCENDLLFVRAIISKPSVMENIDVPLRFFSELIFIGMLRKSLGSNL